MTCFICYSTGDASMNFVRFDDARSAVMLMDQEEISRAMINDDDIEEVRICDKCLSDLRRERGIHVNQKGL